MQERKTILDIIARHVARSTADLSDTDVLTDLGIDSLRFIMLVLEVEQAIGRKVFDINNIGKLVTIGDMLALAD